MDIPELEKLALLLLKSNPRDYQKARAVFRQTVWLDPQALFVMADDAARACVADDWFNNYAKLDRSAKAEGEPDPDGRGHDGNAHEGQSAAASTVRNPSAADLAGARMAKLHAARTVFGSLDKCSGRAASRRRRPPGGNTT